MESVQHFFKSLWTCSDPRDHAKPKHMMQFIVLAATLVTVCNLPTSVYGEEEPNDEDKKVSFLPVLVLAEDGLPLRVPSNDGSEAPNLSALGSEYWYTSGPSYSYAINRPTIDAAASTFVSGTIHDITFSLTGDTAGWTVDELTGSMSGSWPYLEDGADPSVYIIDLVATDSISSGTDVVVETFTMNVKNPVFSPVIAKDANGISLRADYDAGSIYTKGLNVVGLDLMYTAGKQFTYTMFAPVFDPAQTVLTQGTVADISFSLSGQTEGWTVDTTTGMMTGSWPLLDDDSTKATYVMNLVVADARGETEVVVETFTFNVRNPVFTPVVAKDAVTGLTLRAGADAYSTDPNAVGSEYWYFAEEELHQYKFFPPVLNAENTVVTSGTVANITFSLRSVYRPVGQLSSGWTVDEKTGVMIGAWPFLDESPSKFIMNLVATDARGRTARLETYTMNVKNPTFEPVVQTDELGVVVRTGSDGGAELTNFAFVTGVPYTIYPPAFDAAATTVSQGDLSDITYELNGQSEGWSIDTITGVMTGAWPDIDDAEAAVYTMQLVAIDLRGQKRLFEEIVARVTNPTTTTTSQTTLTTITTTETPTTTTGTSTSASTTTSITTTTVSTTTTTVSTSTTTISATSSTVSTTTTSFTDTTLTTTTTSTLTTVTQTSSTTTSITATQTTFTRTSTTKTKTTGTSTTATSFTRTRTSTSKTRTTQTQTTTTRTATTTSITGTTTSITITTKTTATGTTTSLTTTTTVTSSTTKTTSTRTTTTITTTTRTTTTGTTTTTTTTTFVTTVTTTTTLKQASPIPVDISWVPIVVGAVFGVLFVLLLIALAVRLRRGIRSAATRYVPAPLAAQAGSRLHPTGCVCGRCHPEACSCGFCTNSPAAAVLTNPRYNGEILIVPQHYKYQPTSGGYDQTPASNGGLQQYTQGARRVAVLGTHNSNVV